MEHTVLMYSTAYNLWTFTWFVHFELPFRLKGTEKIHTERFSKFPSNIYSILYDCRPSIKKITFSKTFTMRKFFFLEKSNFLRFHCCLNLQVNVQRDRAKKLSIIKYLNEKIKLHQKCAMSNNVEKRKSLI